MMKRTNKTAVHKPDTSPVSITKPQQLLAIVQVIKGLVYSDELLLPGILDILLRLGLLGAQPEGLVVMIRIPPTLGDVRQAWVLLSPVLGLRLVGLELLVTSGTLVFQLMVTPNW